MRVAANKVNLESFALDQTAISGKVGDTVVVNITSRTPNNATDSKVNIGVEDTSVATVATNGDAYTFTLVKEGTTKAHWLADDGNGAKQDLNITVTAA